MGVTVLSSFWVGGVGWESRPYTRNLVCVEVHDALLSLCLCLVFVCVVFPFSVKKNWGRHEACRNEG
jgi:hypothetical protein